MFITIVTLQLKKETDVWSAYNIQSWSSTDKLIIFIGEHESDFWTSEFGRRWQSSFSTFWVSKKLVGKLSIQLSITFERIKKYKQVYLHTSMVSAQVPRAMKWNHTHLVDLSKRAVAQLSNNFPYVVRVDVPMDVLVLLGFLFDFNGGQAEYFAESSERHYLQWNNIQKKRRKIKYQKALHREHYARRDAQPVKKKKQNTFLPLYYQSSHSAPWRKERVDLSCVQSYFTPSISTRCSEGSAVIIPFTSCG